MEGDDGWDPKPLGRCHQIGGESYPGMDVNHVRTLGSECALDQPAGTGVVAAGMMDVMEVIPIKPQHAQSFGSLLFKNRLGTGLQGARQDRNPVTGRDLGLGQIAHVDLDSSGAFGKKHGCDVQDLQGLETNNRRFWTAAAGCGGHDPASPIVKARWLR